MTDQNKKPSGEKPTQQKPEEKKNEGQGNRLPTNKGPNGPQKRPSTDPRNPDPKQLVGAGLAAAALAAALFYATRGGGTGNSTYQQPSNDSPLQRTIQKVTNSAPKDPAKVTFDDVAGIDEVKEDLQEVVELIRANGAEQRKSLGGKAPKGALLYGGPGCGKTLVAKAIASEAGVNFVHRSGSDFVNKYVGVGPDNVRKMFKEARSKAPCVLFIDEIDALARHRSSGSGSSGAREYDNTTNAFLTEMDGMNGRDGVFVIGATNRLDMLDSAAQRPGRFDRKINVPLPDLNGRAAILEVHTRDKIVAADFDPLVIARATPRFSGADLANLANEAALLAERQNKEAIEMVDFENAKDKIILGSGRNIAMDQKELTLTAYHEAGHALVALLEKDSDPVHKATIVPRGGALGMVVRLPEKDQYSMSLNQMKAHLSVGAAGRVAEELYYKTQGIDGAVTSGASGDIQQMTNIATKMVKEWGLSDLGMVNFDTAPQPGTGIVSKAFSEATMQKIDEEIKKIVDEGYNRATALLQENYAAFEAIAQALLEKETLDGDELKAIAIAAGAEVANTASAPSAAPRPFNGPRDAFSANPANDEFEAEAKILPASQRGPKFRR